MRGYIGSYLDCGAESNQGCKSHCGGDLTVIWSGTGEEKDCVVFVGFNLLESYLLC